MNSPAQIDSGQRQLDPVIIAFFVIAYALAWSTLPILNFVANASGIESGFELMKLAEAYEFDSVKESLVIPRWLVYAITRIADFSFTISGLVLIFATRGKPGLAELGRRVIQWKVPIGWYAVAVVPLVLYLVAAILAARDPVVAATLDLSPSAMGRSLFSVGSGFVVYFLARGALGEEPGLRGFALDRLLNNHTPAVAAAIIGVFWVGWHIPVLIGKEAVTVLASCLLMFLLSFVFTWLYMGSKRALVPVMILHASQNSSKSFEAILPGLRTTDWEIVSFLGMLVFSSVICGVIVWQSRRGAAPLPGDTRPTNPG